MCSGLFKKGYLLHLPCGPRRPPLFHIPTGIVFGTIEGLEGWNRASFKCKGQRTYYTESAAKKYHNNFSNISCVACPLSTTFVQEKSLYGTPTLHNHIRKGNETCTRDLLSGNYMSLGLSCAYRMYYVYYIAIDSLLFRDKNSDPLVHYQKMIRRNFPSWNFLRDTWKLFT